MLGLSSRTHLIITVTDKVQASLERDGIKETDWQDVVMVLSASYNTYQAHITNRLATTIVMTLAEVVSRLECEESS